MHVYAKYALIGGGLLLGFKVLQDSKKMRDAIRDKLATGNATVHIGGKNLPKPVDSDSEPTMGPTNDEAGLSNDNPATAYGKEYM